MATVYATIYIQKQFQQKTENPQYMNENEIPRDKLSKRVGSQKHANQTTEIAYAEIERIAQVLELEPTTADLAKSIYHRSIKGSFVESRAIGGVAAASVYAAARVENQARTLDEVADAASATSLPTTCIPAKSILARIHADMKKELGLNTGIVDPKSYVPRFASELELSTEVVAKAEELIDMLPEDKQAGNSPVSIAAGAVYSASLLLNERVTQKEMTAVTDVSHGTIRSHYHQLIENAGIVESPENEE
jgi:transcription initiation factor TFIIB